MPTDQQLKRKFLTYRVQNIPHSVTKETLKDYFIQEDRRDIEVKSLCPSVDTPELQEGDLTATIFFRNHENQEQGPRTASSNIDVDKSFIGFTPLYVPDKEDGPIVADIIAVTGLAGHAYGSWAHTAENMWLRDYLPRDAPNARILTYGYDAALQGSDSFSTLNDYAETFWQNLVSIRDSGQCESRPILFIGHSLGCLIIKKALVEVTLRGLNPSRLPVRTIVFLSAPHRGLNITAMETLVKGKATELLIKDLAQDSKELIGINQQFSHIAKDIDILSCLERKPTNTIITGPDGKWVREGKPELMVTNSSLMYYPKENVIYAETDHSQISKIKRGEGTIYPRIKAAIRQGLASTARIVASVEANSEQVRHELPSSQAVSSSNNALPLVEREEVARKFSNWSSSSPIPSVGSSPEASVTNLALPSEEWRSSSRAPSPGPTCICDICTQERAAQMQSPNIITSNQLCTCDDCNQTRLTAQTQNSMGSQSLAVAPGISNNRNPTPPIPSFQNPDTTNNYAGPRQPYITNNKTGSQVAAQDSDTGAEIQTYRSCTSDTYTGSDFTARSQLNSATNAGQCYGPCTSYDYSKNNLTTQGQDSIPAPESQLCTCNECTQARITAENQDSVCDCSECTQARLSAQTADIRLDNPPEAYCTVCSSQFSMEDVMYCCFTCDQYPQPPTLSDQTLVCEHCKLSGAACQNDDEDGNHDLTGFILRGEEYQRAPIREVRPEDPPIVRAIKTENTSLLTSRVQNPDLLNSKDGDEYTPLHLAIRLGFETMVTILLGAGADMEMLDKDGYTVLSLAIRYKYPNILGQLLSHGADVNLRDEGVDGEWGQSPLHVAAARSNKDCIRILLEYKPNIDTDSGGRTSLIQACIQGNTECAQLLLDAGANPSIYYQYPGYSPLINAVRKDDKTMVELLVKHGATISAKDSEGWTPLIWSATENCKDACIALLEAGANPEISTTADGSTPLILAAEKGHNGIVEALLEKGKANVNAMSNSKWTALTKAAKGGNVDVVNLLIEKGATRNPTPYDDWDYVRWDKKLSMEARREILEVVRC